MDLGFIYLQNVKGHRTPDRGRGFDCGLKVELSWRLELAAGQGFGAPTCSPSFGLGSPASKGALQSHQARLPASASTV